MFQYDVNSLNCTLFLIVFLFKLIRIVKQYIKYDSSLGTFFKLVNRKESISISMQKIVPNSYRF
jgi:hypothetical protein